MRARGGGDPSSRKNRDKVDHEIGGDRFSDQLGGNKTRRVAIITILKLTKSYCNLLQLRATPPTALADGSFQLEREVSLQICCSCSEGRSSMQCLVVVCGSP